MFFVLTFELLLIIGSNNVLTEGARKVYCGRRVGQGWSTGFDQLSLSAVELTFYLFILLAIRIKYSL
jgi:hypothetical protein